MHLHPAQNEWEAEQTKKGGRSSKERKKHHPDSWYHANSVCVEMWENRAFRRYLCPFVCADVWMGVRRNENKRKKSLGVLRMDTTLTHSCSVTWNKLIFHISPSKLDRRVDGQLPSVGFHTFHPGCVLHDCVPAKSGHDHTSPHSSSGGEKTASPSARAFFFLPCLFASKASSVPVWQTGTKSLVVRVEGREWGEGAGNKNHIVLFRWGLSAQNESFRPRYLSHLRKSKVQNKAWRLSGSQWLSAQTGRFWNFKSSAQFSPEIPSTAQQIDRHLKSPSLFA